MSVPMLLLVEDNDDDVFAFRRMLKKAGLDCPLHVARDGEQAVDYLAAAAGRQSDGVFMPSQVFLDLKLPYRDGLEVLEWIRSQPRLSMLPVIILSGSSEQRDRQRASALGIQEYVVKPVSSDDLRRLVTPPGSDHAPGATAN